MSILGSIMNAIFGPAKGSGTPASAPGAPSSSPSTASPSAGSPSAGSPSAAAPSAASSVDVEAILNKAAAQKKEKFDWRHSIVDLMKVLDLDSSLAARKQLAKELHYDGNTDNTATMNIWLHKQVMQKLAANGGKVPDDLKH
jgi:Domain of unknown function (DUF3597)